MSTVPDQLFHFGGVPVGGIETLGMGNVYFACDPTSPIYNTEYIQSKRGTYSDGTERFHSTIQAALDSCSERRNDYVVVLSNFTITTALTMSKNRVHLVGPTGIKPYFPGDYGITQSGAYDVITITGNGCEVAGLGLYGKVSCDLIDIRDTWWSHIHHNYFAMSATANSNNYGVVGEAAIHPNIHHNLFTNHSPGAMSGSNNNIAAFIAFTSGASTRGMIVDNMMHTGANTTVAAGISTGGFGQFILRNHLWEEVAFGAAEAGIFTLGISGGADCLIADNRFGMATNANACSGGTADQSYTRNFTTEDGGRESTALHGYE